MILPYQLDYLPEVLGRFLSRFTQWNPIGRKVILRVTEGEQGFFGTEIFGTIVRIEATPKQAASVISSSTLIQLDLPWKYENRKSSVSHVVLATPRFRGHGPYRLLITSCIVHVFPADESSSKGGLDWEDMIAICEMRLMAEREKPGSENNG